MKQRWLKEAQYLMGIVEQGKAQGSIRHYVDAQDTGRRILNFYWLEANTRLWGPEDLATSGFSKRVLDSILRDIAAAPPESDSITS
jgi:hypothetical protein